MKENEKTTSESIPAPEEIKEPTSTKAPKWLKKLETQSWQAELLISGLVVAGLVRLPDFFIHWVEGYIFESTEMGYIFLSIASLLILAGINSLLVFFGIHFLFRAIWVALLGLNSVYPEGIDVNSTNGTGPKYWKKTKEKYPNLSAYNLELDKKCSLIFSLASVTIIMMTAISAIILLIYQLFRLLISLFPFMTDYVLHIGVAIYFLFLIVSIGIQYLAKKYPDNKRVEKWILGYSSIIGGLFSFYIFQKPIGYITSIYSSNVKSKYFILILTVVSFLLGLTGARQTKNNPVYNNFDGEKYFTFNNKPHQFSAFNYDNLRPEGMRVFTPSISSDVVHGKVMKVFIPTVEREKEKMGLKEFNMWERLKSERSFRDSVYEADLSKYIVFNQILVNDLAYPNLDFQYYEHPNASEDGVLIYLPTDHFLKGKNILEIRKNYFSKDGVQKIIKIPFYFEGE